MVDLDLFLMNCGGVLILDRMLAIERVYQVSSSQYISKIKRNYLCQFHNSPILFNKFFPTIWATIQFVTQMPTIFGFLPTNETLVWHEHFFISDQGNLFILENTFRQPFSVLDIET